MTCIFILMIKVWIAFTNQTNGQLGVSMNFEGRTYFISDTEWYPYEAEVMCHVLNSSLATLKENLDNFSRNLPVDNSYWIGNTDNMTTSGQCILMKTGMNKTTYYQEVCSLKFKFICVKNSTMVTPKPTMSVYDSFLSSMYNGSTTTNWSSKITVSSSLQFEEPPMMTQLPTTGSEKSSSSVEPSVVQKISTSLTQDSTQESLSSSISSVMTISLISNTGIHNSVISADSSTSSSKDFPIGTFREGCTDTSIYQTCTKYETFVMSSTVIVTIYSSSSSSKTANATPNCTCCINSIDTSTYNLEDILNELAVDSKNTSKYTRKHMSVDDKRTSAKAIGYVGAFVICSLVGALIILDGKNFCKGLDRLHIRKERKNNLND
ncbi:hypothetical protein CHS0354_016700 [Potamilus streckersoni]|uniref:C-type lectin domain-containing protein n=1 Tax=Potamilus streckersoni TaxID=2493646 RepID=A0AAE0VSB4_9BIVA|nr:hypothetical protein CHS0354_016700 [Potamilus streckersoni]